MDNHVESTGAPMTKLNQILMMLAGILLVGGIALGAMGMGGGLDMAKIAPSYMFAAAFWGLATIGCFALKLLFHITRGRWGTPILRVFESGGNHIMLVLAFVLFAIPVFVLKDQYYAGWLHPDPADEIIARKAWWLNETFFQIRLVIYFAVMVVFGYRLQAWLRKEEKTGDKRFSDLRNNWAAPGMVLFFVIMSFFTTDVFMSMDPHWYSTIFGFWFAVGSALTALSIAVMIAVTQRDKAPFKGAVDKLMMNDFGNLLLMLIMIWAYFSFSQFLIIWSGNLPEFITFYLRRVREGGFANVGQALILFHFLVPFIALLSPSLKRSKFGLALIAGWIFAMRIVDIWWIIMPYFRKSAMPQPMDLGIWMLIGGIWLGVFAWQLSKNPLLVKAHPYQHNPELKEATENV
ncbi:MAG: hypothetical protein R2688_07180 [Fimbriimonadaceae bacterium]